MKKKFVYIGLVLIVAAFGLLLLAGSLLTSVASGLLAEHNVTVSSMSFSYLQVILVNQTAIFGVVSSKPVNFYVFNSTGFAVWSTEVNSGNAISGYATAVALEGKGLLFGYHNALIGTIPYSQVLGNATPFYNINASRMPAGTYYAVVDNTNGSASDSITFNSTILYPSQTSAAGYASRSASAIAVLASGAGFFVLLIAGIALILYGFFKKTPAQVAGMQTQAAGQAKPKGDMSDEQIDQLYKNIKKKTGRKGKKDSSQ